MAIQSDPVSSEQPVLLGRSAVPSHGDDGKDLALGLPEEDPSEKIQGDSRCKALHRWNPTSWFRLLYSTFGCFVWLAMLCYALQQSFARKSMEFACKFYMMDELGLDGATMGRYMATSSLAWNLKPIWGMLTDAMPLFGFHRRSYLVIMCSFSIGLYLWVGLTPVSTAGIVAFMALTQLTIAVSDLVVDATAASLSKDHPAEACDLQALFSASLATGGIIVGALKGAMVSKLSPRGTLMTNALCVLSVLIPALRGWLPEERLRSGCCKPQLKLFRQNSDLTMASFFLALLAVSLAVSQLFLPNWQSRAVVLGACSIAVLFATYKAFRNMSPYLWKTGLLLFLRPCFTPNLGECMFVWMSKDPNGPRFTPELLGLADGAGQVGLLLGVIVFNKFFRGWKYCKILVLGQILAVLLQFLDLILVMRWNRVIGLPDVLFLVGDEAFDEAVERTFWIPLMVLAYKVAPPNLEATVLSTLLGLRCIGIDCGKFLGVILAEVWGIVDGNFDHLPYGIICKAMVRMLLIPMFILLSPDLTPDDPIPCAGEALESPKTAPSQGKESETRVVSGPCQESC